MIFTVDNFLEKDKFEFIKNLSKSSHVKYVPCYFDGTKEKTDDNTYGFRQYIDLNSNIFFDIKNECLKKFKYKIKKAKSLCLDKRKLTKFKPHTDDKVAKIILYFQIEGQTNLNHGIGFYTNSNLDIHIGFKENRAVLFNSNLLHTPLVDQEVWRTTMTCFIEKGNFI